MSKWNLQEEVACFREWADKHYPDARFGEWECDYPNWGQLYAAVLDFIESRPPVAWTTEELDCILYAIARDNESQHLTASIGEHPQILQYLAAAALEQGEPDAKWQLADELGKAGVFAADVEELLLRMANDTDEYVRRRALMELARLNSPYAEELAVAVWHRADEQQQYARMAALWSLYRTQSPLLENLLDEAEADPRPYLSEYAQRLRRGEVEK